MADETALWADGNLGVAPAAQASPRGEQTQLSRAAQTQGLLPLSQTAQPGMSVGWKIKVFHEKQSSCCSFSWLAEQWWPGGTAR